MLWKFCLQFIKFRDPKNTWQLDILTTIQWVSLVLVGSFHQYTVHFGVTSYISIALETQVPCLCCKNVIFHFPPNILKVLNVRISKSVLNLFLSSFFFSSGCGWAFGHTLSGKFCLWFNQFTLKCLIEQLGNRVFSVHAPVCGISETRWELELPRISKHFPRKLRKSDKHEKTLKDFSIKWTKEKLWL